ncbi:MAG: hypothetical protein NWE81_01795 [Candidatus Bathyarchaeota archaeon]|jgi:hypothetical protein|nr:hypothetical protein [Candidatus Bathyarchaeota archaeon]
MPSKKIRVEVFDEEGNRYSIALEGVVTREKALRLFDIIELLGGVRDSLGQNSTPTDGSKFEKTKAIIETYFPFIWFSSGEIQASFEREFSEPVPLSTVSTYLSRMTCRGLLISKGPRNCRRYRAIAKSRLEALRKGPRKPKEALR